MKFLRLNNMTCRVCMPLLAVLMWSVTSTSQASIQLPEESHLDVQRLFAEADSQDNSSAGTSSETQRDRQNTPSQEDVPSEPNQLDFLHAYTSPSHTFPGGSTSGTSSSGNSGGNNVSSLASLPAVNLSDAELVAWVASEQRFSLPMPPGNVLLRPPQV